MNYQIQFVAPAGLEIQVVFNENTINIQLLNFIYSKVYSQKYKYSLYSILIQDNCFFNLYSIITTAFNYYYVIFDN